MKDIHARLADLRRPTLLLTPARIATTDHRRDRALARLLGRANMRPGEAVTRLIELEGLHEARRRAGDTGYVVARHVEVLTALLAETRLFTVAEDSAAASGDHLR